MFKKIEIWVLYLVLLFSIIFAVGFGVLVRHEMLGGVGLSKINMGWLSKTALTLAEIPANIKRISKGSDLAVADRFPSLDGFNGLPNSLESYLLLSRYDGDLEDGLVELVNLNNFEVLHSWNPDIDELNHLVEKVDEFKYLNRDHNDKRSSLIHPKLTKDGGLLFHTNPFRKIDACSNLIFQNTHDTFHHSIETDIDGNIWVPSNLYPQTLPEKKIGKNITQENGFYDDAIVKLSPNGNLLFEKSVSQIFIDNGLEYLIFAQGDDYERDPIHLNDIQPVNFDSNYWKKGDVFLSMRNQSMVALYRPSSNKIIWKGVGPFFHQHDVDIIDDHRISIFNNSSINVVGNTTNAVDGYNEVIIYNFKTKKYSSYLQNSFDEHDVISTTNGRSEILPNGDLFIEETIYGRTLYFNSDGTLRWTHLNRANNGNVYRVGWSRILYTEEDINIVNNFLKNKGKCDE